jgi:outer membrane protein
MKSFIIITSFVIMAFVTPIVVTAQTTGIVYVDLQRVMLESERGKEVKKILTDEMNKVKRNLDVKQDELQKMKDAIEKQAATITPEARAEKEKQYQAKLKDYQRLANDAQTELQQKDMEYTQKVVKEMEDVVKNIALRDKYLLILEKSSGGILYASPSIDITTKVIAGYNESAKKK